MKGMSHESLKFYVPTCPIFVGPVTNMILKESVDLEISTLIWIHCRKKIVVGDERKD